MYMYNIVIHYTEAEATLIHYACNIIVSNAQGLALPENTTNDIKTLQGIVSSLKPVI